MFLECVKGVVGGKYFEEESSTEIVRYTATRKVLSGCVASRYDNIKGTVRNGRDKV